MKTPRSLQNSIRMLSVLFVFLLIAASFAAADSMARIVRLSYVDGDNVQIDRNDSNGYSQAYANEPIIEGASLWVGDNSRAEVQFEDGSTMRLGPNSAVNFNELRLADSGHFSTMISVQEGVVYFNLLHKNDDLFRVMFAKYQIDVTNAAKFRIDGDDSELHLAVTSGAVDFVNVNGARMDIRRNETLSFDLTDPTRPYMAREVATLTDDTWNQERDEELARQSAASNFNDYNQNYSYGFSDLNNYGSYSNDPQYGNLWRPNNIGYDWDPFSAGYWVYYPITGWTWVSAYPWGWAPYRYGSWVYIRGGGWYWRCPHNYYRHVVYTPVVVNAPPTYSRLVLPTRPNNPHVGGGTGGRVGVIVVNRGPNDRNNPFSRHPGTVNNGGNNSGGVVGGGGPVDRGRINTGGGTPVIPGGGSVITNETLRTSRPTRGTLSGGDPRPTVNNGDLPTRERSNNNGGGLGISRGSRPPQVETPIEPSRIEDGRNERRGQPTSGEPVRVGGEPARGERLGRGNSQGNGGSLGVGNIPDTHPRSEPPANPEVQPERERRSIPTQPVEQRNNYSGGPPQRSTPEPARPAPQQPAPQSAPVRSAPAAPAAPAAPTTPRSAPPADTSKPKGQ